MLKGLFLLVGITSCSAYHIHLGFGPEEEDSVSQLPIQLVQNPAEGFVEQLSRLFHRRVFGDGFSAPPIAQAQPVITVVEWSNDGSSSQDVDNVFERSTPLADENPLQWTLPTLLGRPAWEESRSMRARSALNRLRSLLFPIFRSRVEGDLSPDCGPLTLAAVPIVTEDQQPTLVSEANNDNNISDSDNSNNSSGEESQEQQQAEQAAAQPEEQQQQQEASASSADVGSTDAPPAGESTTTDAFPSSSPSSSSTEPAPGTVPAIEFPIASDAATVTTNDENPPAAVLIESQDAAADAAASVPVVGLATEEPSPASTSRFANNPFRVVQLGILMVAGVTLLVVVSVQFIQRNRGGKRFTPVRVEEEEEAGRSGSSAATTSAVQTAALHTPAAAALHTPAAAVDGLTSSVLVISAPATTAGGGGAHSSTYPYV